MPERGVRLSRPDAEPACRGVFPVSVLAAGCRYQLCRYGMCGLWRGPAIGY